MVPPLAPFLLTALVLCLCQSCGHVNKLSRLRDEELRAGIRLPENADSTMAELRDEPGKAPRDTFEVLDFDGRKVLIMKAVKDEDGDGMIATEQLDAAVVSARFRNVAERRGKVNLEFQVIVPERMRDSRWQLRLRPRLYVLGDSLALDDLLVTGEAYRRKQLRGYERYERFVSRIVSDSLDFVDVRSLEIFVERNIPQLYAYRNDSTYVSEEEFRSLFGVTERQALEHYTRHLLVSRNEWLKSRKERKWRRYVRSPILDEGVRLDTVFVGDEGEFIYNYVQTLNMRPRMRKVDVKVGGEIFEEDRRLYSIAESEPLTFYVSSISSFADERVRYETRVVERAVRRGATSHIGFRAGASEVEEGYASNFNEISSVKSSLQKMISDDSFVLDSVTIVAFASPEGDLRSNTRLTYDRARAVSEYFSSYVRYLEDSIGRDEGFVVDFGGVLPSGPVPSAAASGRKHGTDFISRSGGENWALLDQLVSADSLLTDEDKRRYDELRKEEDPDLREEALRGSSCYMHLRDSLYPRLRTVRLGFHLHRKGMVKDTVHTTVVDTAYMRGVALLKEHDYEGAMDILAPYRDFNSALACVALDRNSSALAILESEPKTARVNYLLAVLYGRLGREEEAVGAYVRACGQDPSLLHRGNLDPEIALLKQKYSL